MTSEPPPKKTVLVVDDVSVDRKVAARCLERLGYRYSLAYDGVQALQMLRVQAVDLVSGFGGGGGREQRPPHCRGFVVCLDFPPPHPTLHVSPPGACLVALPWPPLRWLGDSCRPRYCWVHVLRAYVCR